MNFIKKENLVRVFPSELCEVFKNTFFTEHFQWKSAKLRAYVLTC